MRRSGATGKSGSAGVARRRRLGRFALNRRRLPARRQHRRHRHARHQFFHVSHPFAVRSPNRTHIARFRRACSICDQQHGALLSSESPTAEPSIFASRAARVTLVMSCLFGTTGVILVFLPRWLEVERGLTGAEIGAMLSLRAIRAHPHRPGHRHWADGAADRAHAAPLISIAAVIAYAAFFFLAQRLLAAARRSASSRFR